VTSLFPSPGIDGGPGRFNEVVLNEQSLPVAGSGRVSWPCPSADRGSPRWRANSPGQGNLRWKRTGGSD